MDNIARQQLRDFLGENLASAGDAHELGVGDSLFVSGRLDSLAMTRLVLYLEQAFGINFAEVDFDVDLIDSVEAIAALVDSAQARQA